MEASPKKLIVHIVTHGKHQKQGKGPSGYDGPLTTEGVTTVSALKEKLWREHLSRSNVHIFRGEMKRHAHTARVLDVPATLIRECGRDEDMFLALDPENPHCQEPVTRFRDWLRELSRTGYNEVLLIGSRILPLLVKYLQEGGEKKYGKFAHFCNAIAETDWGVEIPMMVSGRLWTFETTFVFPDR